MKYAAISINFDSLGWGYNFPEKYRDPSFFEVADRFMEISDKHNFKYSMYMIGKDLEKEENFKQVRKWSKQGHEIGNHSWTHPLNLEALKPKEIYNQIKSCHKIVSKATGKAPKGFIAPSWSISPRIIRMLLNLDYSYDTSIFPSWVMGPVLLRLFYNYIGSGKLHEVFNRKDGLANLIGPRGIFQSNGNMLRNRIVKGKSLTMLPLPTNKLRLPCWHTTGFKFGYKYQRSLLKSCLKENDFFYYVIHPSDLIDKNDLDPKKNIYLDRLEVPLKEKKKYYTEMIETIVNSGRKIVTIEEFVQKYQENKAKKSQQKHSR